MGFFLHIMGQARGEFEGVFLVALLEDDEKRMLIFNSLNSRLPLRWE